MGEAPNIAHGERGREWGREGGSMIPGTMWRGRRAAHMRRRSRRTRPAWGGSVPSASGHQPAHEPNQGKHARHGANKPAGRPPACRAGRKPGLGDTEKLGLQTQMVARGCEGLGIPEGYRNPIRRGWWPADVGRKMLAGAGWETPTEFHGLRVAFREAPSAAPIISNEPPFTPFAP